MNKKQTLIIGDVITFAILTYIGFASHGEGELALLPRMGTTLFPILFGWFLLAPWFGLFHENVTTTQQDLVLRAPLAMLFVAPLASILRSALALLQVIKTKSIITFCCSLIPNYFPQTV
jgi:hypothetical protein